MVKLLVAVRACPALFFPVIEIAYVAAGSSRSAAVQVALSLLRPPARVPLAVLPSRSV